MTQYAGLIMRASSRVVFNFGHDHAESISTSSVGFTHSVVRLAVTFIQGNCGDFCRILAEQRRAPFIGLDSGGQRRLSENASEGDLDGADPRRTWIRVDG